LRYQYSIPNGIPIPELKIQKNKLKEGFISIKKGFTQESKEKNDNKNFINY
jgi:hypothetical protein